MAKNKNKLRPFQVIAEIIKIETKARGGLRVIIDTNELMPSESALIMEYRQQQGHFLFSPEEIGQDEVDNLPDIKLEDGEKSPSQRLRSVLYRVWEYSPARKEGRTFELFYRNVMEQLVEGYKKKIEDHG